ncbi:MULTISPECIES: hypothetical protein [Planktothricoides]|uniref:Transposase n=2 Tax=Planktothricoides raciborskii TaxID=132608 RepID=A0AAU8JKZ9_9CYAN|nr:MULTISPECIES: hypothetical protein [Planktothricoides]MBD2547705.1 hypothetical protein [Planktothricoides raciborskii FACHB-1370]MBD2586133.1 hypothetical protein [Planktothricoides raciborskii FACHB-1261]
MRDRQPNKSSERSLLSLLTQLIYQFKAKIYACNASPKEQMGKPQISVRAKHSGRYVIA